MIAKYLAGCGCFSLGAYLFIVSELGTDPLDVFALGLARHIPVTIGLAQFGVALLCVAAVALWTRRRPLLSPVLTFFLCGSLIDLQLWSQWAHRLPAPGYVTLVTATLCCAYGSALIIMSGLGIRAMDLVAIQALRSWGLPFWAGKGALEGVLLLAGYLMGGPVGVGTVFFLVGVDLLIQPMIRLNERSLRIANHGMPEPASSS
ncbi:YczE/YyaS/YitT family protein [Streptomyces sp. NPDC055078]